MEDATLNPDDFTNAALNNNEADWDKLYEGFDAAVDWPTVNFYKELFNRYPDAKVILTVRSAESWYESVKNTIYRIVVEGPEIPPEHRLYSFGKMCRTVTFGGVIYDPEKFEDKEGIMKLFNDHNAEVKKVIPANQLYVMELGSGWDGLCQFLGKEVPREPYPKSNSTAEFQRKVDNDLKDIKRNQSYGV